MFVEGFDEKPFIPRGSP